jgi:hypothetical protein
MARFYNARGEVVVTDSDICPPGCHVRANVMLLDGLDGTQRAIARARIVDAFGLPAGHRQGYAFLTDKSGDDARAEAYLAHKQQVSDAWRSPSATAVDAAAPTDAQPTAADATEAAYAARDIYLRDAWKTTR